MKLQILFIFFLLFRESSIAQINIADSSVQVISYWDKGEKQNYTITSQEIKLRDTDTVENELTSYNVEITILDSTAKSYTVQWHYKNVTTNSTNEVIQKLMSLNKEMKVIFKTDEMGIFEEVVNWKEIRAHNRQAIDMLRKEFKLIPEMDKMLKKIESMYASKEAIESLCIKDIHQFHIFHGAKYTLGEIFEGTQKVPNHYGKEPFDSYYSVYLDEINESDNNGVLRSSQEVDADQLLNATYNFLSDLAKTMKTDPPVRDAIKDLKNEILTASRIHGTGWVVYSVQTKTVTANNITNIEERIIDINFE